MDALYSAGGRAAVGGTFGRARSAVDNGRYEQTLEALASLPVNVRDHSGPRMRLLYGYLLYRAALLQDRDSRFQDAAESLETLVAEELAWSDRHPEVYYLIGRSRFRSGDFSMSVQAMARFVELARSPVRGEHEAPSVPSDIDEPPLAGAPTTDAPGESPRDAATHL